MAKTAGLAKQQLRALDRLSRLAILDRFHLAGGSAIAWHLKHRRSLDLDFFSSVPDVDLGPVRDAILDLDGSAAVVSETEVVLKVRFGEEPLDFVRYPYPLLEAPVRGPSGVNVAGLRDLAAMKLAAVARRGIRRDFWDLHAILSADRTLPAAAESYLSRFGRARSDLYHVARALTWFEDAETDPAFPRGLSRRHWAEVRRSSSARPRACCSERRIRDPGRLRRRSRRRRPRAGSRGCRRSGC